MIGARFSRGLSPQTSILVRVVAFVAAAVSIVVIPAVLAAAASGHGRLDHAFEVVAAAAAITLLLTAVARGLDPLRR